MIIRLKNKYQLALQKMVQDCENKGGIPDYIEVIPGEAWDILKEMQACKSKKAKYEAKYSLAGAEDVRFQIYGSSPIDIEMANVLVRRWMKEEFIVSYDEIPIKVVQKKKVDNPPEKEDNTK